ncbi:MAG: hypothetical protein ACREJX_13835, partial [Polyangiaceae bacterium]
MKTARISLLFFLLFSLGCGSTQIALHEPQCVTRGREAGATTIDFQPISMPSETNSVVPGDYVLEPPPPNDVLTSAISSELNARALRGGEPGGYVVQCKL